MCIRDSVQLAADVADGGGNVIDLQQIGIDPLDVVPARNACGRHRTERLKIQHQFLQLFDLVFFQMGDQLGKAQAGVLFVQRQHHHGQPVLRLNALLGRQVHIRPGHHIRDGLRGHAAAPAIRLSVQIFCRKHIPDVLFRSILHGRVRRHHFMQIEGDPPHRCV